MLKKGDNVYIDRGDFKGNHGRIVEVKLFKFRWLEVVHEYIVNVYTRDGKILASIHPDNLFKKYRTDQ